MILHEFREPKLLNITSFDAEIIKLHSFFRLYVLGIKSEVDVLFDIFKLYYVLESILQDFGTIMSSPS